MDISSELSKAERLIAAGQLEEAKAVLRGVLAQDKRNADAWYLVAQSVTDPKAKAEALRRVLLIEPDHPRAKREFEAMDGWTILKAPSREESEMTPTPPTRTAAPPVPDTKTAVPTPLILSKQPSSRLWLGIGGAVAALILVVFIVFVSSRGGETPDSVARIFIHALLTNDDNTAMSALSSDSRAQTATFCSPPFVVCLSRSLNMPSGTQDTGSTLLSQSGPAAVAQVRLRVSGNPTDMCVTVQMQNENGWKVVDTRGNVTTCNGAPVALAAIQPAADNGGMTLVALQTLSAQLTATMAQGLADIHNSNATLGAVGNNYGLTMAVVVANATATAAVPTQTVAAFATQMSAFVKVGQVWQGEDLENDKDHVPVSVRIISVTGIQFVAEVTWPSFGNTTTHAEGKFVSDASAAGSDDVWRLLPNYDPSHHPIGMRFRELAFVQGNGVALKTEYLFLFGADKTTLSGAWRIPGAHGLMTLKAQNSSS